MTNILKSYLESPKKQLDKSKLEEFTSIFATNDNINVILLDGCCRIELIKPITDYLKTKSEFCFIIDNMEKPKIRAEIEKMFLLIGNVMTFELPTQKCCHGKI